MFAESGEQRYALGELAPEVLWLHHRSTHDVCQQQDREHHEPCQHDLDDTRECERREGAQERTNDAGEQRSHTWFVSQHRGCSRRSSPRPGAQGEAEDTRYTPTSAPPVPTSSPVLSATCLCPSSLLVIRC